MFVLRCDSLICLRGDDNSNINKSTVTKGTSMSKRFTATRMVMISTTMTMMPALIDNEKKMAMIMTGLIIIIFITALT